MKLLDSIHEKYIFKRRVNVLSDAISLLIPKNSSVLDIGCGDGLIDRLILQKRPDVKITGLDVLIRDKTFIEVIKFDGNSIPYPDNSFDCAMFIDVLHHTTDPMILLKEAARVSNKSIVIKDHLKEGFLAEKTLRFMDWVGNARHKVVLPYNYWSQEQWDRAFNQLKLKPISFETNLGLYPFPINLLFERHLHFIALLEKHQ
jgi:ubiquinone/menaquinone biosynthesis C-methylase UbiE